MGKGAIGRVLASALIAFGSVGLAGCAPQSNSGFQAVANPSPNAAAVQRQSPPTAALVRGLDLIPCDIRVRLDLRLPREGG